MTKPKKGSKKAYQMGRNSSSGKQKLFHPKQSEQRNLYKIDLSRTRNTSYQTAIPKAIKLPDIAREFQQEKIAQSYTAENQPEDPTNRRQKFKKIIHPDNNNKEASNQIPK